jgi:hypothetical protein
MNMSTHRKIEWSLFILGLLGTASSFWLDATTVQTVLFAVSAIFAGLHALKMYDGHKSNHTVVATSLALVAYVSYLSVIDLSGIINKYDIMSGLIVAVLLSILSLRLRRDFHTK